MTITLDDGTKVIVTKESINFQASLAERALDMAAYESRFGERLSADPEQIA